MWSWASGGVPSTPKPLIIMASVFRTSCQPPLTKSYLRPGLSDDDGNDDENFDDLNDFVPLPYSDAILEEVKLSSDKQVPPKNKQKGRIKKIGRKKSSRKSSWHLSPLWPNDVIIKEVVN